MNEIHVGLIGWGSAAATFHAPLIRATTGLRLAAVATRSPEHVVPLVHATCGPQVRVTSPEALIGDATLDLVVVATPNDSHFPLAAAALAAGRHVVVDKPFALDFAQARALAAHAAAAGRQLCVFHNRRWDGDFLTLQRVLHEGVLGRAVEFVSHFDRFRPQVRSRWRERPGAGTGLWFDLGPHLLDQALRLFGWPSSIALDRAVQREGASTDDWFSCRLLWRNGPHAGLRARLQAGMLVARPGPRFELHGRAGSMTVEGLDPQEDALKRGEDPAAPGWGHDSRERAWIWRADGARVPVLLQAGDYPRFYAGVRDALRGLLPLPVALDDALAVQRLLDEGVHSAEGRCDVALDFLA
ncbi:oxidoreductase [Rubrivivax gelatinosus]|uniref:oxidoreductase n=1 Tax=Rubrivivax gelatinosus TaxID=28068 RepID=UPI003A80C3AD